MAFDESGRRERNLPKSLHDSNRQVSASKTSIYQHSISSSSNLIGTVENLDYRLRFLSAQRPPNTQMTRLPFYYASVGYLLQNRKLKFANTMISCCRQREVW